MFSDPDSKNEEYIVIATNSIAYAVNLRTGTATSIDYPAGETLDSDAHMVQAFNYVFIFRDGLTALEWDGDFTGTPAFQLVADGDYTQPVYLNAATNTAIADGVYRVRITDANGCTLTSAPVNVMGTSVAEVSDVSLMVFPNPVNDLLYITGAGNSDYNIRLWNSAGAEMITDKPINGKLLVSHLPAGVYVLSLSSVSGTLHRMFVKQ